MRGTGRFIIHFVILMCFKRHWPGFFLRIDSSGAGLIESLRVSMGLTVSRKTARNLVVRRKN